MYNKPNAVVYVTPNSIAVAGKKVTAARLSLAPDIINYMEVVNVQKLIDASKRFFEEHGLKGKRVVMVLDPRIVFDKTISLDKVGNPAALTKSFVSAMPFEPGQRACVSANTGNQLRVFATNADYYEAVAEALRVVGRIKVAAITPASAYDMSGAEKSFGAAVAVFMKDAVVQKSYDFQDATVY